MAPGGRRPGKHPLERRVIRRLAVCIVLAARVRGHAEGPRSERMKVSFALAREQPGEVLTLHAAHVFVVDAELLDPVLPVSGDGVCTGRPSRRRSW
jgi:hypothetical protein